MGFIKHFRDDFDCPKDNNNEIDYDSGLFSRWKDTKEKFSNEIEKPLNRLSVDDLVKILNGRNKKELNLILSKLNDKK